MNAAPVTVGTAGHVDHGKTALVAALTGVDTDVLPEEKARGLTIALGFAPLRLPSGRQLSLVDVPGHERFVRTMVAGATGVDAFVMAIAADDCVMPQTREHAAILEGLGVQAGVVAITKADAADPARALEEADALLPRCERVVCSARTGAGLDRLLAAIERAVAPLGRRAGSGDADATVLHVDRVFTIRGHGTIVTGTLVAGVAAVGDQLQLAPAGAPVRVRAVEVHGRDVARATAGQRVALNLTGLRLEAVRRGDAIATAGVLTGRRVLDCALARTTARHGQRVQVHHGTRAVSARLGAIDGALWQLRLDRPLLARDGDRLLVRSLSTAETLGGGVVLDATARRHGRGEEVVRRLRALHAGHVEQRPPAPRAAAARPLAERRLDGAARRLEQRLLAAGPQLVSSAQLDDARPQLRALRAAGVAVNVGGRLFGHATAVAQLDEQIVRLLAARGPMTLAQLRDALGISRKSAQAFVERLDALGATRRGHDDRRALAIPVPEALERAAAQRARGTR